jgi:predicted protein tyrosine phosphatase
MWTRVALCCRNGSAVDFISMYIESVKQTMRIASVEEALGMSPAELSGWSVLSIRGIGESALVFPGARRVKNLCFEDVEADHPDAALIAARPEDIADALVFAGKVGVEPLLIHCHAGISRSTAIAWLIIYDKLKGMPDAVRQAFEIVRQLRPILIPNQHVLRLGMELLVPQVKREQVMKQVKECLAEIKPSE